jgi:hypothetical protein
MRRTIALFALSGLFLGGCQTLHTDDGQSLPIAVWSNFESIDKQGAPATQPPASKASAALTSAGIPSKVDQGGITVPSADAERAREVLLTDPSLKGSELTVLVGVPAGTAKRTADGLVIPLAPPAKP